MMNSTLKILAMIIAAILLSACTGQAIREDSENNVVAPVVDGSRDADDGGAVTSGINRVGMIDGIAINQDSSPDYVRTIYFEYDSSEVRSEFISLIRSHAELLASDRRQRVVLEGHADERGSREYNIALGERRAVSVRRLLLGSGAGRDQIRLVSYGEERPAVIGHNESAWSKNRRVQIRYE